MNNAVKLTRDRGDFEVLKKRKRAIEMLVPNLAIWIVKATREFFGYEWVVFLSLMLNQAL